MVLVLKTSVGQLTASSNLALSAIENRPDICLVYFLALRYATPSLSLAIPTPLGYYMTITTSGKKEYHVKIHH